LARRKGEMGLMYGEGSENTRKERERKEAMGKL
jgi:hypothetical protein